MNKFYLGTGLVNTDIAKEYIKELEDIGFKCTFNWANVKKEYDGLERDMVNGVLEADFCVFLLPGKRGTHFEMGCAIGSKKPSFLIKLDSYDEEDTCFYRCLHKTKNLDEVLATLQILWLSSN